MSRLLLGVTGGIAAYKMLETARLALKAGHAVRAIQTETSRRFVGAASFAAITGAPVLLTEFDDDPLRGAYPGDPAPDAAAKQGTPDAGNGAGSAGAGLPRCPTHNAVLLRYGGRTWCRFCETNRYRSLQ